MAVGREPVGESKENATTSQWFNTSVHSDDWCCFFYHRRVDFLSYLWRSFRVDPCMWTLPPYTNMDDTINAQLRRGRTVCLKLNATIILYWVSLSALPECPIDNIGLSLPGLLVLLLIVCTICSCQFVTHAKRTKEKKSLVYAFGLLGWCGCTTKLWGCSMVKAVCAFDLLYFPFTKGNEKDKYLTLIGGLMLAK